MVIGHINLEEVLDLDYVEVDGELTPAAQRLTQQTIECNTGSQTWTVRVPMDYEVWRNGLFKRNLKTFDPSRPWPVPQLDTDASPAHIKDHLTRLTSFPVYFERTGYKLRWKKESQFTELLCKVAYHTGEGYVRRPWVSAATISDQRSITNLAKTGADINSINAREVILFLAAMRGENRELSALRVAQRLCYYEVENRPCWFVGDRWIGPMDGVDLDIENQSELQAAYGPSKHIVDHEKGYAEWKRFVEPYIMHPTRGALARWTFAVAFLPPIASLIGQRGFIAHFYAQSLRGKSALAALAMSAFGDPTQGGLFQFLDKTLPAVMNKFEEHISHLPVLFDEVQAIGAMRLDTMIYSMAGGQARGRLSSEGRDTRSDEATFLAIPMFTGEEPIVGKSRRDAGGQGNRTIEVDVNQAAALPPDMVIAIYTFFRRRLWGWAGIDYLSKISSLTRTDEGRATLVQKHVDMEVTLRSILPHDPSIVPRMASVALAEYLMLVLVFPYIFGDIPRADMLVKARDLAISDAQTIYSLTIAAGRAEQGRPLAERALEVLRAHFVANPGLYPDLDTQEGLELYARGASSRAGFIGFRRNSPTKPDERELIYLQPGLESIVKEHLEIGAQVVINGFADMGMCVRSNTTRDLRVERGVIGILPKQRYFVVPLHVLTTENEPVDLSVLSSWDPEALPASIETDTGQEDSVSLSS
jgi:hypothetical protein